MPRSHWIEPGRLLAGEYPGAATAAQARVRLDALLGAGISYFIDLTCPGELPPYDHLLPSVRTDDDRYVVYVRKPIPDHGVPAAREAMAETLDYIACALEVGHRVYLHCAAGIGRANTVAGCWLRRSGLGADDALAHLNRLWRANPRADSFASVPETAAQRRYVESWAEPAAPAQSAPEPPLDPAAVRLLRGRYQGSLMGLACGDAMGATTQYRKVGQFTPIAGLVGGGHWQLPPGAWTDDTAMSLCVAESLLTLESLDPGDQRERYRRWQREGHLSSTGQCVGITAAVAAALRDDPAAAARADPASASGGAHAVTRAGVVALFMASDPERALAWSAAAAAVTEPSIAGRNAAMVYAALLLAALRGATRETLVAQARELWSEHARAPIGIFDVALGVGAHRGASHDHGAGADPFAALQTVAVALAGSDGFRDGLVGLVNRGGDADLHGALFGQLAGALYGVGAIPPAWRAGVLGRELVEAFADRLLVAALAPRN